MKANIKFIRLWSLLLAIVMVVGLMPVRAFAERIITPINDPTYSNGMVFDKWVVESGSVTLASENNKTTFFTMPAGDVSVKATYKDLAFVKNIDVTVTAPHIGQTPDYAPVIDADPADSVELQDVTWYNKHTTPC